VRDDRPETYRWHFVDLAMAEDRYDAAEHCHATENDGCIVAELEVADGAAHADSLGATRLESSMNAAGAEPTAVWNGLAFPYTSGGK